MGHYSDYIIEEAKKEREERIAQSKQYITDAVSKMDYWDLRILSSVLLNWKSFKGFLKFIKNVDGIDDNG